MAKFKKGDKVITISATITNSRRNPLPRKHVDIVAGINLDEDRIWFKADGNGSYSMKDFELYQEPVTIAPPQIIEPRRTDIPQVGDKVIITKSEKNWADSMNQFVGKILTISETKNGEIAEFVEADREMNHWIWNYSDGHFKLYEEPIQEFPPFTILQQIDTISEKNVIKQVMNAEGNMFEVGDKVTSLEFKSSRIKLPILKFRLTSDKTGICAIISESFPNGINIDKLQHFVEFKPKEPEFVLPENWYVQITRENLKTLSDWRGTLPKPRSGREFSSNAAPGYVVFFDADMRSHGHYYKHKPVNVPEITFEQFEKYVLIKEPQVVQELPEERFVLPETYHVVSTEENRNQLSRWLGCSANFNIPIDSVCGMVKQTYDLHPRKSYNPNTLSDKENFGIEITWEQFQQYVLNQ